MPACPPARPPLPPSAAPAHPRPSPGGGAGVARGFTLIELLVVLLVVAVLTALVYPSYAESVRKSRRADAQSALVELVQVMERHYTAQGSYTAATLPFTQAPRTGTAHYALDLQARTADTYTLRATPQGDQAADACGTLTITHSGARAAATAGCWR